MLPSLRPSDGKTHRCPPRAPSIRMCTPAPPLPSARSTISNWSAMSEAGFAAIVTKDHDYSGVMTAALIRALSGAAHEGLLLHRAEQCRRRPQSVCGRAYGGDGRQDLLDADPDGGKPSALGEDLELGASRFDDENPQGERPFPLSRLERFATTSRKSST